MQTTFISFSDTELEAAITCAKSRLTLITPGLSIRTARAFVNKWRELGPNAAQIVLDLDPEIYRLGFGDSEGLELLLAVAEQLGSEIRHQRGLRIGVIVTDETTTIYSPTPLLIEAGGKPGERSSAIRVGLPLIAPDPSKSESFANVNLAPNRVLEEDAQDTLDDLKTDPPLKFDIARKIRVFNAKFEFVEFELRGLSISKKKVQIPSDLMGLENASSIQKLLQSSFKLIEDESHLSGDRVNKVKQAIVRKYLKILPRYGTILLRANKADFEKDVDTLKRYVARFQRIVQDELQAKMDVNKEKLVNALLPTVTANQPSRWRCYGKDLSREVVTKLLQVELTNVFGSAKEMIEEMSVKVIYKGVTYELLDDINFMATAQKALPHLEVLHEEFEAAKAEQHQMDFAS